MSIRTFVLVTGVAFGLPTFVMMALLLPLTGVESWFENIPTLLEFAISRPVAGTEISFAAVGLLTFALNIDAVLRNIDEEAMKNSIVRFNKYSVIYHPRLLNESGKKANRRVWLGTLVFLVGGFLCFPELTAARGAL